MKRYSLTQLARAYLALRQQTSSGHAFQALAAALISQRRTHHADLVIREIRQQQLRQGEAVVEIETAHELPRAVKNNLETIITKLTSTKTVTARYSVQPELIGGFRATTPTHIMDASIARLLEKL